MLAKKCKNHVCMIHVFSVVISLSNVSSLFTKQIYQGTLNLRSLCCESPLTYKNIISLILIKYFRERFFIFALQLPDE